MAPAQTTMMPRAATSTRITRATRTITMTNSRTITLATTTTITMATMELVATRPGTAKKAGTPTRSQLLREPAPEALIMSLKSIWGSRGRIRSQQRSRPQWLTLTASTQAQAEATPEPWASKAPSTLRAASLPPATQEWSLISSSSSSNSRTRATSSVSLTFER